MDYMLPRLRPLPAATNKEARLDANTLFSIINEYNWHIEDFLRITKTWEMFNPSKSQALGKELLSTIFAYYNQWIRCGLESVTQKINITNEEMEKKRTLEFFLDELMLYAKVSGAEKEAYLTRAYAARHPTTILFEALIWSQRWDESGGLKPRSHGAMLVNLKAKYNQLQLQSFRRENCHKSRPSMLHACTGGTAHEHGNEHIFVGSSAQKEWDKRMRNWSLKDAGGTKPGDFLRDLRYNYTQEESRALKNMIEPFLRQYEKAILKNPDADEAKVESLVENYASQLPERDEYSLSFLGKSLDVRGPCAGCRAYYRYKQPVGFYAGPDDKVDFNPHLFEKTSRGRYGVCAESRTYVQCIRNTN